MSESKPSSAGKNKAFKPRANVVRKTKAEREAHAKEEAEKAAARAAASAQAAGKAAQLSKASSSKRRETPRDNRDNDQGSSGGVFGAGTGTKQTWRKSTVDAGRSEMLEGQEAIKATDEPRLQGQHEGADTSGKQSGGGMGSGARAPRLMDDEDAYDTDDEPEEQKRDIERIWISSDDDLVEGAPSNGKGKARTTKDRHNKPSASLRPVRARRASSDNQNVDDEQKAEKRAARSSRMAIDNAEDAQQDVEEMEVDDDHFTDQSHVKQDVPSSPELSRKTKFGRKSGLRAKDSKLVTETVEERAERLRLYEDIEKLREEFVPTAEVKVDDDMEDAYDDGRPDGKYFLFQFPPLIPFLQDSATASSAAQDIKQQATPHGPNIKPDPDAPNPPAVDSGADNAATGWKPPTDGMLTASESVRLPPGRVGQMRVHKSGKITLDWGGTDMEVRYGTEVDFLQDVVLVETPAQPVEDKDRPPQSSTGTTYALGQVQKKLVVIPDWQMLYD